jgi:hypothetical protein
VQLYVQGCYECLICLVHVAYPYQAAPRSQETSQHRMPAPDQVGFCYKYACWYLTAVMSSSELLPSRLPAHHRARQRSRRVSCPPLSCTVDFVVVRAR